MQSINQKASDFSLTNSFIRAAFNTSDIRAYDVYSNNIKKNYALANIYVARAPTSLNYYIDATIGQDLFDMIPLIPIGKLKIDLTDYIPT